MTANENITLVDNKNIISSDTEIAKKRNNFFSNVIKELKIKFSKSPEVDYLNKIKEDFLCDVSNVNDPVERAIQKYKSHPSIQMIKENFDNDKHFHLTSSRQTPFLRKSLGTNNLHIATMYHPKLLKPMLICFQTLYPSFPIMYPTLYPKSVISFCIFLSALNTAEITPVQKKSKLNKSNHRPVSLLLNTSKLFERCMQRQFSEYFETISLKFQCDFRKDYGTQDCLLAIVVNYKKALDQRKEY